MYVGDHRLTLLGLLSGSGLGLGLSLAWCLCLGHVEVVVVRWRKM